jgi:hypothetical protein
MLRALSASDVRRLVNYIGGVTVDEPQRQTGGIMAMLRISRAHSDAVDAVVGALKRIKPTDLKVAALVTLEPTDAPEVVAQFESMAAASGKQDLQRAVLTAKEGI